MSETNVIEKPVETQEEAANLPVVQWDDSHMRTTYANASNVISSREEVAFIFGVNLGKRQGEDQIKIDLSDRILLTPHAAKRFQMMLNSVIEKHEAKFGHIQAIETPPPPPPDNPM